MLPDLSINVICFAVAWIEVGENPNQPVKIGHLWSTITNVPEIGYDDFLILIGSHRSFQTVHVRDASKNIHGTVLFKNGSPVPMRCCSLAACLLPKLPGHRDKWSLAILNMATNAV